MLSQQHGRCFSQAYNGKTELLFSIPALTAHLKAEQLPAVWWSCEAGWGSVSRVTVMPCTGAGWLCETAERAVIWIGCFSTISCHSVENLLINLAFKCCLPTCEFWHACCLMHSWNLTQDKDTVLTYLQLSDLHLFIITWKKQWHCAEMQLGTKSRNNWKL